MFGVDIDANAVEIAKLRLWLSIIQDVEGAEHIQTLPNIDFNIFSGNSLIGWLNETLVAPPLTNLMENHSIKENYDHLRTFHRVVVEDVETSSLYLKFRKHSKSIPKACHNLHA